MSDGPHDQNSESSGTKITYVDGEPRSLQLQKLHIRVHPNRDDARHLTFDRNSVSIGSDEHNDIALDDSTVSTRHCRILRQGDSYIAEDLDSTNGTFINGVRIREAYLDPGSILALGNSRLRFEPVEERVPVEPSDERRYGTIVGSSVEMREIFDILEKISPTDATVVLEGETGTGKGVVAETIHEMSPRSEGPFVVFDCGAVPQNLVESELFGHEKGSFTGAVMSREGLFEQADGGTIFLDELAELSADLQPKLLRVLEEREIRRVGGNRSIPVDVRVIAATNRNLEEEVREGRFRQDLFYRLSVVRLRLPPLRDRLEDVPLLVRHFLANRDFNRDTEGDPLLETASEEALDALRSYEWPGNVRELENVVQRACSFSSDATLQLEDLPEHISGIESAGRTIPAPPTLESEPEQWTDVPRKKKLKEKPFKEAKQEWIAAFERDYITDLLVRHDGNISSAAREAEIDRKYFRTLMTQHDIEVDEVS